MKFAQRFATVLSVILALAFLVCGSLLLLTPENALALVDSEPNVSEPRTNGLYKIPENPPSAANPLRTFGNFAWETFVALNWPADCSGSPLKEEEIGKDSNAPRVWEFYNYPEDIFKPNGEQPTPEPVTPPQCQNGNVGRIARNLRLTEIASNPKFAKFGPALIPPHEQTMDAKLNPELPFGYVLVDRAGNYVLNEPRMNPVEVDEIVENKWYSATQLAALNFNNDVSSSYANPFKLTCSSKGDYYYPTSNHPVAPCKKNKTEGAIEIKAAWMVLPKDSESPDGQLRDRLPDPNKYYTTERTFLVETPKSEKKQVTIPVALIGFHIVHKTSLQGWIWSTFEHIDNVLDPDPQGSDKLECYKPPELSYYNLYDPNSESPVNTPLASTPYLWRDEFPHAVTEKDGKIVEQERSNITRQVCIPSVAAELNEDWQQKLKGSVWKNYQLIGVQWLKQPYDPYGDGRDMFPKRLINAALEPYPQEVPEDFLKQFPDAGFSCVACHTAATLPDRRIKADFSFLMHHAK